MRCNAATKTIRIPITNFDDDWEWTPAATEGDAALITVDDVHLVQVTNLDDGQVTTVTVTTTRTGWFDGTNTPRRRSVGGATVAGVGCCGADGGWV